MDSLTASAPEIIPAPAPLPVPAAASPAPAMPREAPLAMPVQSLRRFSRSERRAWADPTRARTPWLERLFVFGGALALTVYGEREMYGVVEVGVITPLEWALVGLFVLTFSWICLAFTQCVLGFAWAGLAEDAVSTATLVPAARISTPVTAPSIRYRRAINRVELILVYLFLVPARGPALASEYGCPGSAADQAPRCAGFSS